MVGSLQAWRRAVWVLAGVVIGVAAAQPAAAQSHIGLVIGPTMANLAGDLVESSDIAWGVFVGLNYELELGEDWQLDAEFGLSQKGASRVPTADGPIDYNLSYIEVPVTINRLFWIADGRWAISPYLGLAAGMATSCGVRPSGEFDYTDCDETTPGGAYEKLDLSVPIGVAFRHRYRGGSAMAVEARYSVGLSAVFDTGSGTARNNVATVMFSFVFPLDHGGSSSGRGQ